MDRERTHWDGCWQERTHHDCALARIAALEAELAKRTESERLSHEIADREREPILGGAA